MIISHVNAFATATSLMVDGTGIRPVWNLHLFPCLLRD